LALANNEEKATLNSLGPFCLLDGLLLELSYPSSHNATPPFTLYPPQTIHPIFLDQKEVSIIIIILHVGILSY